MSWEGMPFGNARNVLNQSSLVSPNSAISTQLSQPAMTAQIATMVMSMSRWALTTFDSRVSDGDEVLCEVFVLWHGRYPYWLTPTRIRHGSVIRHELQGSLMRLPCGIAKNVHNASRWVGDRAIWVHDHPTTSFLGATALAALLSFGSFHTAGQHSEHRGTFLAAAGEATEISRTYEQHATHLARVAGSDFRHGDTREAYLEMAQARIVSHTAFHESQVAGYDAARADEQLAACQADEWWGVADAGIAGALLLSAGYSFFRRP